MKKTQYFLFMVAMLYALSPLFAQAAYDTVTTDGSSSIVLDDSSSYVIDPSNRVESFTVNASTIAFDLLPGSVISITSNDRKNFSYSATTCETIQKTCSTSFSRLFIQCNNQSTSHTVTVTPSGTCTANSGGGSSGGGGGSSAPTAPTPVVPEVKPVVKVEPKPEPKPEPISAPVISMAPVTATFTIGKPQVLKIGGETHTVNVSSVSKAGLVTLTVQSKPVKISLKKGQSLNIDTDGDKVNDMKVTLVSLAGNKPQLKFTPLVVVKAEPVTAPYADYSKFIFKKQMKPGSNSADVKQLQIKLKSLGYLSASVTPNSNFGPATTLAVKKFQKANKIAQVGNVGPATLKALNK